MRARRARAKVGGGRDQLGAEEESKVKRQEMRSREISPGQTTGLRERGRARFSPENTREP